MSLRDDMGERRFTEFLGQLGKALGHADRIEPLRAYITGLLLPGERKSVEPMASRVDPRHVRARHQSMHHFVAQAPWDERTLLRAARAYALEHFERHGGVTAWVVDDTGMPKKGSSSVGVARQYCGALGKQDNCQVAVSLSLTNDALSVKAAYRLYLPEDWSKDAERRRKAGIPTEMQFKTKWQIALDEIAQLVDEGVQEAPVVADAGYGDVTEFRDGLTALHLHYAVGVKSATSVWLPGEEPLPPKPYSGRGQPQKRLRRTYSHHPESVRQLAFKLPHTAWQQVRWREGTRGAMKSRFAAVRVRPAHRDNKRTVPRPTEWLLVEWPSEEREPSKYWLSTLPEVVALPELVRFAKIRWRIERDYEELKDEIGLDHYEGRGWRGFHHHGALCIAAHAFVSAERARLSPPEAIAFLKAPSIPKNYRPRGSAHSRAAT